MVSMSWRATRGRKVAIGIGRSIVGPARRATTRWARRITCRSSGGAGRARRSAHESMSMRVTIPFLTVARTSCRQRPVLRCPSSISALALRVSFTRSSWESEARGVKTGRTRSMRSVWGIVPSSDERGTLGMTASSFLLLADSSARGRQKQAPPTGRIPARLDGRSTPMLQGWYIRIIALSMTSRALIMTITNTRP